MEIEYRRAGRVAVFFDGNHSSIREADSRTRQTSPAHPDPAAQRDHGTL